MHARPKMIIFVLGEPEIDRLGYEKFGRELLTNDDVLILSIDVSKSNKLIKILKSRGLYSRGQVLAKSPYGADSYEEITNASYAFAVEKYMYFSQLCNILGAKEVTVQRLDKVSRSGTKSLDFMAMISGQKQELSIKDKDLNKLQSQISIKDVFVGGTPNIREAQVFLEKNNLLGDETMLSLLEIRQQTANPISSRQLTLNLSNESKKIIDVVGKIRLPTYLSEITSSFNSTIRNSVEYMLTMEVKF